MEYKTIDKKYKELYNKYAHTKNPVKDYSYYLHSVSEYGRSLSDVPDIYRTDEMILKALKTKNCPIILPSKQDIEGLIKKFCIEKRHLEEEEKKEFRTSLTWILYEKYDKSLSNSAFQNAHLYTFFDFYDEVSRYFSGMDTISYLYMYEGMTIPISIGNGLEGYKFYGLSFDYTTKILHKKEITEKEYDHLWQHLAGLLKVYYCCSKIQEYWWMFNPTDLVEIPILQDGIIYERYETVNENGAVYDFSRSYLFSIPDNITEFIIPETVSEFDNSCFRGNTKLKKITISSRLWEIPEMAFMDCTSLEEVDLSSVNVDYDIDRITVKTAAFCNCKSLHIIDFSKLTIGYDSNLCFANCFKLKNIEGIQQDYGGSTSFLFYHCDSLTGIVDCEKLYLGDYNFACCKELKAVINIKSDVPVGSFLGCEKIEYVEFSGGGSWIHIGDYSFAGCKSLACIDISKSILKSVGDYAFEQCVSLVELKLNSKCWHEFRISDNAFNKDSTTVIKWSSSDSYYDEETIMDYYNWQKQEDNEIDKTNRKCIQKTKQFLLDTYGALSHKTSGEERRKIIGYLFSSKGDVMGSRLCDILNKDICNYDEALKISKLFCESIDYCNVKENGTLCILEAVFSWAKSFSIQAYKKAVIHNRFEPLSLLYEIVVKAHNILLDYLKTEGIVDNGESTSEDIGIMPSSVYSDELYNVITNDEIKFIESLNSLSNSQLPYIIRYYLLKHIATYHNIQNELEGIFDDNKKEIVELQLKIQTIGTITPRSLSKVCSIIWHEFIYDDINDNYIELGAVEISPQTNTETYISFDFSKGILCFEERAMFEQYPMGINIIGIENENNYPRIDYENEDDPDYYSGTYAHDVAGYSDEEIDDIFDGEPDAYWNID